MTRRRMGCPRSSRRIVCACLVGQWALGGAAFVPPWTTCPGTAAPGSMPQAAPVKAQTLVDSEQETKQAVKSRGRDRSERSEGVGEAMADPGGAVAAVYRAQRDWEDEWHDSILEAPVEPATIKNSSSPRNRTDEDSGRPPSVPLHEMKLLRPMAESLSKDEISAKKELGHKLVNATTTAAAAVAAEVQDTGSTWFKDMWGTVTKWTGLGGKDGESGGAASTDVQGAGASRGNITRAGRRRVGAVLTSRQERRMRMKAAKAKAKAAAEEAARAAAASAAAVWDDRPVIKSNGSDLMLRVRGWGRDAWGAVRAKVVDVSKWSATLRSDPAVEAPARRIQSKVDTGQNSPFSLLARLDPSGFGEYLQRQQMIQPNDLVNLPRDVAGVCEQVKDDIRHFWTCLIKTIVPYVPEPMPQRPIVGVERPKAGRVRDGPLNAAPLILRSEYSRRVAPETELEDDVNDTELQEQAKQDEGQMGIGEEETLYDVEVVRVDPSDEATYDVEDEVVSQRPALEQEDMDTARADWQEQDWVVQGRLLSKQSSAVDVMEKAAELVAAAGASAAAKASSNGAAEPPVAPATLQRDLASRAPTLTTTEEDVKRPFSVTPSTSLTDSFAPDERRSRLTGWLTGISTAFRPKEDPARKRTELERRMKLIRRVPKKMDDRFLRTVSRKLRGDRLRIREFQLQTDRFRNSLVSAPAYYDSVVALFGSLESADEVMLPLISTLPEQSKRRQLAEVFRERRPQKQPQLGRSAGGMGRGAVRQALYGVTSTVGGWLSASKGAVGGLTQKLVNAVVGNRTIELAIVSDDPSLAAINEASPMMSVEEERRLDEELRLMRDLDPAEEVLVLLGEQNFEHLLARVRLYQKGGISAIDLWRSVERVCTKQGRTMGDVNLVVSWIMTLDMMQGQRKAELLRDVHDGQMRMRAEGSWDDSSSDVHGDR